MASAAHKVFGGGSSAFSPKSVAGLVAWYDASQITGVADGAALATWPDLSGNSNNLTGEVDPTYYKTTSAKLVNGKPAVWFDGSTNWMANFAFNFSQPIGILAVVRYTGGTRNAVFAGAPSNEPLVEAINTGAWAMDSAGTPLLGGSINASGPNLVVALFNGSSSQLRIDRSATASGTAGSNGYSPTHFLILGSTYTFNSSVAWQGPICELLIYDTNLIGTAGLTQLESYLHTKWGTP